ncbi:MAG: hypothetical protein AB200_00670 [Parcubacteria bacterium C7867-005]|nr:MAG: hypothetical protein AB200_00670 [Parcubacteria bacterium C7867-005]
MYKTKTISYDSRALAFWTLTSLCALSLVIYIYGINATVHNTVTRQNMEKQVSSITTALGEMEFKYISLKNSISLEVAYEKGFKDVDTPVFISRASTPTLSINR